MCGQLFGDSREYSERTFLSSSNKLEHVVLVGACRVSTACGRNSSDSRPVVRSHTRTLNRLLSLGRRENSTKYYSVVCECAQYIHPPYIRAVRCWYPSTAPITTSTLTLYRLEGWRANRQMEFGHIHIRVTSRRRNSRAPALEGKAICEGGWHSRVQWGQLCPLAVRGSARGARTAPIGSPRLVRSPGQFYCGGFTSCTA